MARRGTAYGAVQDGFRTPGPPGTGVQSLSTPRRIACVVDGP